MVRKIIKLLFIVVLLFLIFSLSSETGQNSSKRSDGLIIRTSQLLLNRKLTRVEKERVVKLLVVPVRKMAHIVIYLLLGIAIVSFYSEFSNIERLDIIICMLICLIFSILDEIHQIFVIGRSGEIKDVFIDLFGSIMGILMYYRYRLKGRKKYE